MTSTFDDETGQAGEEANGTPAVSRMLTINNNCIDSREIFIQAREIMILHGPDTYRLRLTSQNKLILTK